MCNYMSPVFNVVSMVTGALGWGMVGMISSHTLVAQRYQQYLSWEEEKRGGGGRFYPLEGFLIGFPFVGFVGWHSHQFTKYCPLQFVVCYYIILHIPFTFYLIFKHFNFCYWG